MFDIVRLDSSKVKLVKQLMNKDMGKNYCEEGKMQEKGTRTEELFINLLRFLKGVKVEKSKTGSVADVVLKLDILLTIEEEDWVDHYMLQIKSSKEACLEFEIRYDEEIEYEGNTFSRPGCIYKGNKSALDLLDELCEMFCCNLCIDLEKLEMIADKVNNANGNRLPKKNFDTLSRREITALRVLYNIGCNSKTYFLK